MPPINLGSVQAAAAYFGGAPLSKIYLGTQQVWSAISSPPAPTLEEQVQALFAGGVPGGMWDASDLSTLSLLSDGSGSPAVGSAVGRVADKSGRGNHLVQASAAKRPLLQTDGSGFSYLNFDGSDDGLASAAFAFGRGQVTVCLGIRPTGGTLGIPLSFGGGSAGSFELIAPYASAIRFRSYGTTQAEAISAASYAPPFSMVAAAVGDIAADTAILRADGVQIASAATDQGAGNYGTFALNVGQRANTNYFTGRIYAAVVIGRQLSMAEQSLVEAWIGSKMGIALPYGVGFSDVSDAFFGYYTTSGSTRRFARNKSALAFRIKGTAADLYCSSGDATPFKVLVDGDNFANAVTPTLASGKIPLFSGLADAEHSVLVWSDNSDTGQGFPTTGALASVTGSAPGVKPLGVSYLTADPAFPGVYTGPMAVNASYSPAVPIPSSSVGWGSRNTGSLHFRAKFSDLYLFCFAPFIYVSIDGGAMQKITLAASAPDAGGNNLCWKKVPGLSGSLSSFKSLIISGAGNASAAGSSEILGVMLTGTGAQMLAPSGTRRHCVMFGASQVEGTALAGNVTNSACTDVHRVQTTVPIYALSAGLSGGTIAAAITAFPGWAARIPNKDIILLSIGVNSNDDAQFTTDYTALIQAALTAGFKRVVCRGLVDTGGFHAPKNVRIQAAVASFASPDVLYAGTATWTSSTDGSVGIHMPDGAHPNEAGYQTMADWWARDHAAMFA